MAERESTQRYRFDELGSLQFERLCVELLASLAGIGRSEWHRAKRSCAFVSPEGIALVDRGTTFVGPTLAVIAWLRPANGSAAPPERLSDVLEQALADWRRLKPRSLLGLTNAPAPALSLPGVDTTVLGSEELTALVASSSQLRLRVPTVLGIGAAEDLVAADVADRSTGDIAAARALAPVFVPTRAYAATVDVLAQHHFAVLTGPPEMGKTAIARTVGLAALTNGWELHECLRPDELWERFRRDRRQVFVADDAFGSTEYRPDAAERWAVELDRVLRAMDEKHWLLWTSRPAPFKAGLRRLHREHGVERFPQPAQVHVDAADLEIAEKALILFRHAKSASLPRAAVELVRAEGWTIVSHPHFTPERIRRFVATRLLDLSMRVGVDHDVEEAVAAEIREPTDAMAASFRALSDQHRALLVALLDTPPGPTTERELVAAFRRHSRTGLAQQPTELVDRLTDHFLRRVDERTVTWVHPSWRDLVIEQLRENRAERETFLRRSSLDGLLLALSTAGGAEGGRHLPLLLEDSDWDAIADRLANLIPTLDDTDLTRLFVALGEAQEAVEDDERGELDYLAGDVLRRVAQRWSESHSPLAIGALRSWFALAESLEEEPRRPELATTWIELAPTAAVELSAEEIGRFDDWTSLSELLREQAPDALARFGFPGTYRPVTDAFVSAVEAAAADRAALPKARRELLAAIVRRLSRLGASDPERSESVASRIATTPAESELPELYPQRSVSPELREILDAPAVKPPSDEALVARVLRDL